MKFPANNKNRLAANWNPRSRNVAKFSANELDSEQNISPKKKRKEKCSVANFQIITRIITNKAANFKSPDFQVARDVAAFPPKSADN